jgi:hypothetical protein
MTDIHEAAFRLADMTMTYAVQHNMPLEDATLLLIQTYENYKHEFTEQEQSEARAIVAQAASDLRDVWRGA